jgi:hypothetical protein
MTKSHATGQGWMHDEDVEFEREVEVVVMVDEDDVVTVEVDEADPEDDVVTVEVDEADPEVELHVLAAPISTLGQLEAELLDELTVRLLALDEPFVEGESVLEYTGAWDGLRKYAPMAMMIIIMTMIATISAALAPRLSFESMLVDSAELFNRK